MDRPFRGRLIVPAPMCFRRRWQSRHGHGKEAHSFGRGASERTLRWLLRRCDRGSAVPGGQASADGPPVPAVNPSPCRPAFSCPLYFWEGAEERRSSFPGDATSVDENLGTATARWVWVCCAWLRVVRYLPFFPFSIQPLRSGWDRSPGQIPVIDGTPFQLIGSSYGCPTILGHDIGHRGASSL